MHADLTPPPQPPQKKQTENNVSLYSLNVCNHACYAVDGPIALQAKRKGSPCQRDDDSLGADMEIHPVPSLPEVCHKMFMMEYLSTSES